MESVDIAITIIALATMGVVVFILLFGTRRRQPAGSSLPLGTVLVSKEPLTRAALGRLRKEWRALGGATVVDGGLDVRFPPRCSCCGGSIEAIVVPDHEYLETTEPNGYVGCALCEHPEGEHLR